MSYTPTVWNKGDIITVAKLNKIENGIGNSFSPYIVNITYDETDEPLVDKTYAQVVQAMSDGLPVLYMDIGAIATTISSMVRYEVSDDVIEIYMPNGIDSNGLLMLSMFYHNALGFSADNPLSA